MDLTDLAPGGDVYDADFGPGTTLPGSLARVEFEACRFSGIVFDAVDLRGTAFRDCRFDDCSLSGVRWADASLGGCEFTGCRLVGTSFSVLAPSVVVDPCVMVPRRVAMCAMADRDMSRWTFTDCDVTECDLDGTDLRHASFRDCDLTGTSIRRCDLRDAEMPGTRGLVLDVRENRVSGLLVDAASAASLLAPFGIRLG